MIYTVTVMGKFKKDVELLNQSISPKDGIYWIPDSQWTAGYFTKLEDAIDAVKHNHADVFEHCYDYAVIEAFGEGFYPIGEIEQIWFKYDYDTNQAYQIDPPVYNKISSYAF